MGRMNDALADALREADEATQCQRCGEYQGAHLKQCPQPRGPMNRYRVVFEIPPASHGVQFVDAPSEALAITAVALQHDVFRLVSCTLERAGKVSMEDQRDGLLRALRPLYTVCRALLDNPSTAPLFTPATREGLEVMCADAVTAMKAAGVTQ